MESKRFRLRLVDGVCCGSMYAIGKGDGWNNHVLCTGVVKKMLKRLPKRIEVCVNRKQTRSAKVRVVVDNASYGFVYINHIPGNYGSTMYESALVKVKRALCLKGKMIEFWFGVRKV